MMRTALLLAALLLAALVAFTGCEDPPPPEDAVEADSLAVGLPPASGAAHPGALADGDSTIASGEFADEVRFTARRGQRVVVDLASKEGLDTYLIVRSPAGIQHENDDFGEAGHSRVELDAETSGMWRAIATSYDAGQTGPYTLRIRVE